MPKTFADPTQQARIRALINCQVETGIAIRDTVQLERSSIQNGWLRIERQKTGRPVKQPLRPELYEELMAVTNGNPRYVFWNGTSLPETATGRWQADLKRLMEDAGVWIRGNLSHRFRDTFVSKALASGWTLGDVADALGDTLAIVEKHYKSLDDKRQEARLAKLPRGAWAKTRMTLSSEQRIVCATSLTVNKLLIAT